MPAPLRKWEVDLIYSKKAFVSKLQALIMEYESVFGADAIVGSIRDALLLEANKRNDDIGILYAGCAL
jgi:hypothetical protein